MSANLQMDNTCMSVIGPLTVDTVNGLMNSAPEFSGNTVNTIDLGQVNELDSAGLALLVHWKSLIAENGGKVAFLNAMPQAISLMRVSGLEHMIEG